MNRYYELKQASEHYKNETNFCSVIALAVLKDWSFGRARKYMHKYCNRADGKGTYRDMMSQYAFTGAKRGNFDAYVQALKADGKELIPVPWIGKRVKPILKRASSLQGTFLIYIQRHVITIKDGIVCDWTEVPERIDQTRCGRTIQGAYMVKDCN
jgi:hypothetical protein